jgi:hypothetical protein
MQPMTKSQRFMVAVLGLSTAALVVAAGLPHTHDSAASHATHACRLCRVQQELRATPAKPVLVAPTVWPQAAGTVLLLAGVRPAAFNLTATSPRAPPLAS